MVTVPFAYTRRFFEKEEVIISSCNSCFAPVAESSHEYALEILEHEHSRLHEADGAGDDAIEVCEALAVY